ncbi:hypothetical protein [Kribbella sp. NPDC048915]|uniref:hypothetical protein n=1 Tax=Kribbella sp. NPDC048915 TaxID=3155148 RepID=UPI0033DC746E
MDLVGPLLEAWRPVELRSQVVHGDLPGPSTWTAELRAGYAPVIDVALSYAG